MATTPPLEPDIIEPGAPPEVTPSPQPEMEPPMPDIDEPGRGPDELPPELPDGSI